MKTKRFRAIVGFITSALLILVSVWVVSGRATGSQRADTSFEASYPPPTKPALSRIAANGAGWNFELVGQNPLLDSDPGALDPGLTPMGIQRGSNGNLGVAAGPCVYVGSLAGSLPALVVDVSDPRKPTVVGPVPGHVPGIGHGIDAIDTIPDLNLMVIHMRPAVWSGFKRENATALQIYDISDCRRPRLVTNYTLGQENGVNTGMHMSTIWRDPANPARVLHLTSFLATNSDSATTKPELGLDRDVRRDGIDIRVVDLTGCPTSCNPRVVAKWGLEAEAGIPRMISVTYPDGNVVTRAAVTHQATFSVDGTRIWVAQLGMGFFGLNSELLAKNQSCNPESPMLGEDPAKRTTHCLRLLNPTVIEDLNRSTRTDVPGRLSWDSPFFGGATHTAANVPRGDGKTYVIAADETWYGACPWAWMRVLYVGGPDQLSQEKFLGKRVSWRGDLFPGVLGSMGTAQNVPDRCPTPEAQLPPVSSPSGTYGKEILQNADGFHGPHEPLVFPNLVIATYYSSGLQAYSIANPLMPVNIGAFYHKPVATVRFCSTDCLDDVRDEQGRSIRRPPDVSKSPVDIKAFSRPIAKDGLIYYVDWESGLFIVRYKGPHAGEIPQKGTCVTGQVHTAGFEPCPPYK